MKIKILQRVKTRRSHRVERALFRLVFASNKQHSDSATMKTRFVDLYSVCCSNIVYIYCIPNVDFDLHNENSYFLLLNTFEIQFLSMFSNKNLKLLLYNVHFIIERFALRFR